MQFNTAQSSPTATNLAAGRRRHSKQAVYYTAGLEPSGNYPVGHQCAQCWRLVRKINLKMATASPVVFCVILALCRHMAAVEDKIFADTEGEPPCSARSTCAGRESDQRTSYIKYKNCFCDDVCVQYGDCCGDYVKSTTTRKPRLARHTVSCRRVLEIGQLYEFYIVDKCPRDYPDKGISEACKREYVGYNDTFYILPVTGGATGVLYRNYFCALCAGERNITFWRADVKCKNPVAHNSTDDAGNALMRVLHADGSSRCRQTFKHPPGMSPRKCKSHVGKCDRHWQGSRVVKQRCRNGPTSYVYIALEVFRNRECALCNFVNDSDASCVDNRTPRKPSIRPEAAISFRLLLDLNMFTLRKSLFSDGSNTAINQVIHLEQCNPGHIYDPYARACRAIRCPNGDVFSGGVCVEKADMMADITTTGALNNNTETTTTTTTTTTTSVLPTTTITTTTTITSHEVETIYQPTTTITTHSTTQSSNLETVDPLHRENLLSNCPQIMLNESEYVLLSNRSIIYVAFGKLLSPHQYARSGHHVFVCSPYTSRNSNTTRNVTVFMFAFNRYQNLASVVGTVISLFALFVYFIVYGMLPLLRNIPGRCIFSLALCLFVGQLLLLAGTPRVDVKAVCVACAVSMHYAFLASFFWMNVLAIDLCRTLSWNGVPDRGQNIRFVLYSLYAWLTPACIVGGSLALDMFDLMQDYRPDYGVGNVVCWLTSRRAILFLFVLPIALLFVINIVLYCITVASLCAASKDVSASRGDDCRQNHLLLYVKLLVLMGCTWIFGLLATLTEWHVLWYAFVAFNTLQGAFLCLAFVCTRSVFRMLHGFGQITSAEPNGRAGRYCASKGPRTTHTRPTYMYDGEQALVISQETSI